MTQSTEFKLVLSGGGLKGLSHVGVLLALEERGLVPSLVVGSSMGGHVSTAGSRLLRTAGLFLMAPAFYVPGFEEQTPEPAECPVTIVHGWRDDVVPVENSIRFARQHGASLHLLDTDHRMQDKIREIGYYFEYFLITLDKFGE